MFENVDPHAKNLADTMPSYRAMFYLRHPEKIEDVLELEVSFKPNEAEPGKFETSKAVWRRCGKPDILSQAPPLEMFSIRLHRYDSMSQSLCSGLIVAVVYRGSSKSRRKMLWMLPASRHRWTYSCATFNSRNLPATRNLHSQATGSSHGHLTCEYLGLSRRPRLGGA